MSEKCKHEFVMGHNDGDNFVRCEWCGNKPDLREELADKVQSVIIDNIRENQSVNKIADFILSKETLELLKGQYEIYLNSNSLDGTSHKIRVKQDDKKG